MHWRLTNQGWPQHVWVDLSGSSTSRCPGVLVMWRYDHVRKSWSAWCAWVSGGGNVEVSLQQGWVRAEHLTPR